jgi:hypothetical protein
VSVLDKVRQWIDGESAESVLEEAARNAQVKPRSQSEEFIVRIARAVEDVMQKEMVPLPQGTTIIPTEYIIFLSAEDDKEWQGIKRKGLEQGLYHILAERAREISGKKKLETKTFVVELRVDGTLEKGDVRVQHGWEDSSGGKTDVLARPKMPNHNQEPVRDHQAASSFTPQTPHSYNNSLPSPDFGKNLTASPTQPPSTLPQFKVAPTSPLHQEECEEMTHVQKRQTELYRLEIWRENVRQNVVSVFQNELSIGRGSKSKPVDIMLPGDPEISRRHLILTTDGAGNFWLINEGRNPAMINNYELPTGQRVSVSSGMTIAICSYLLRIQAK